ncbi:MULTISPECIES: ABC transporter permease [Paraburkholderia]|uniref:ABC transporter permease n=1 Tax=Paraburkholderia podalyriae TaxID=1938811 RepID=A0ABR7PSJ7_9BURK|nr:ABC transporter permease [Paraburkholderia podalyriae]MBC8749282.1 ABC transporter permease [Paraburkholderia podalyriae]
MRAVSLRTCAYHVCLWSTLGFVVLPLVIVVWVSFFANKIVGFPATGYTLHWYGHAWAQDPFREGFVTSVQVGLCATVIALLIGVPAALALARATFPGKGVINTMLLSPMLVPGIVAGCAVYVYYIQIEIFTEWQVAATLPGLIAAHTLLAVPWVVRLVTASLQSVGSGVEEAALNLGATPWTTFRRVTLPLARPGLVAGGLFSFIVSFTDVEKSLFLVGPGRTTLPIGIINYLEWNLDPTITAVATVQIVIIGIALVVSNRYVKLSHVF